MVAAVRSLADLQTEIRQRCDQEGTTFVADATELANWINQSAAALFDLILDYAGQEAFLTRDDLSIVAGTDTYDLPTDFYRLVGVDVLFDGRWKALDRGGFIDRNRWQDAGWTSPRDTRYMLRGRTTAGVQQIMFIPEPTGAFDVRVWYLPLATTITTGTPPEDPAVSLVSFNGWDEWIVCDVCAKVLEKEESASRPFLQRRAETQLRIIAAAKQLDSGEPLRMRDVLEERGAIEDVEPLWRD